ncbi:MAG: hypothetical protein N3E49_02695 [Bacteroidia bacterium]|nr:hypothetical protein [Bacteroidia bacterium]
MGGLRILSAKERQRLRGWIEGTRLEWLRDTLLRKETYSEAKLSEPSLALTPSFCSATSAAYGKRFKISGLVQKF